MKTKMSKKEIELLNKKLKGKKVIIRSDLAGVFYCELKNIFSNGNVAIKDARKLYSFYGAETVEDIAVTGVENRSQVTVPVKFLLIKEFVQIIPCEDAAIENLNAQPIWTAATN